MEAGNNKRPTAQVFKDKASCISYTRITSRSVFLDEKLTFVDLNPQGNEAFKKADFQAAVEHYTAAIKADPSDHILPCNRAFARLKLQQLPANYDHHDFEDLKAALALEPNNASICAELEAVKSHLQKDAIIPETSSPPNASTPNSTVSSDSESSSANQPTPGPSSSTALTDKRSSDSSNSLMKEVSTTRFTSSDPKNSTTKAAAGTSFSALKQIRQKKEEKSSGLLTCRNPKTSASSPTDLSKCEAKPTKIPSSSSTNSIPPVRSFADFEMRWGMSSQPELRCSVLEALDQRHVARLFGEHLEPETLEQIIDAMQVLLKSVFQTVLVSNLTGS
ncbi:hypothetical protein PGT21_010350 [Puccinia graminis f. sp. tritici]|uniref:RNA polymerase II-associated protein 3 n=1 Tax=Puccinia graminis f. sp. tritici TaxID=56615 RepID=A0A5B0LX67_PUCGR|nr:hypothetical protein PGT21_010350 [Puccinia graminis f. sp. tritici]